MASAPNPCKCQVSLGAESQACSPQQDASVAKKEGLRTCLSRLISRSEASLKELQRREHAKDGPTVAGARDRQNGRGTKKRRKGNKGQRGSSSEGDELPARVEQPTESTNPRIYQKRTSTALSSSEPNLWRNGLQRKFGSLGWRQWRSGHLQLSVHPGTRASDPRPLGRLQRPAVGSDLDMRGQLLPSESRESSDLPFQLCEIDFARASLVPSSSFDTLCPRGDGSSWEGSCSICNPSLCSPTSPETTEVPELQSVQEETRKPVEAPSKWAESTPVGYLPSRSSLLTLIGDLESSSIDSGESPSEPIGRAKGLKAASWMECPLELVNCGSAVTTSLAKKVTEVRYEIMITLTKEESEKLEGDLTASSAERGPGCHQPVEVTLSLGVADLEKTEEHSHQKPARPAPQLSAHQEFQNCTVLCRVGTSEARRQVLAAATECLVTPQRGSDSSPTWRKDQSQTGQLHLRHGVLVDGTGIVAPGFLASSLSESCIISLRAAVGKEVHPRRLCDIERGPYPIPNIMKKVTGASQSKPGGSVANISLRWKKMVPALSKEEPKVPAVSQLIERGGDSSSRVRTNSPSRVSMLLEAWEKGLVGTESTGPSSSANSRRSRSPLQTRRLLSSKETAHPLFPANAKTGMSPTDTRQSSSLVDSRRSLFQAATGRSPSPVDARRSRFRANSGRSPSPADTRRSPSPADIGRSPSPVDSGRSPSPADTRQFFSPPNIRRSFFQADSRRSFFPSDSRRSPSPASMRRSFSPASTRRALSPADSLQSPSPSDIRRSCSPANTRQSCFQADARCLSPSPSPVDTQGSPSLPDIRCSYSRHLVDARRPFTPTDVRCSPPPADSRHLFSVVDTRRSSSPADAGWSSPTDVRRPFPMTSARHRSPSPADSLCASPPADSRGVSSSSDGRRSRSLSPQRDYTAHGPVFSQVYSPGSKPKNLEGKERQDANSTLGAKTQGEHYTQGASTPPLRTPTTDVSQKEGQVSSGASSTGSLKESQLSPALRSQTETYQSRSAHPTLCSRCLEENHAPGVASAETYGGATVTSATAETVSSSGTAESETQWFGSKSTNTFILRSEQQVILPKAGSAALYTAGRELIMSNSRVGNMSKQPQQDRVLVPTSSGDVSSKENYWQLQSDPTKAQSPKGSPASIPDASHSTNSVAESWHENCMTQPSSTGVSNAQRLETNPAFTSNTVATPLREGAVNVCTPQRDCSTHSRTTIQKPRSLFLASNSERDRTMSDPGGKITNAPELENQRTWTEKVNLFGFQGSSEAGGSSGESASSILGTSAGSQETASGEQKATTQPELREEQSDPMKDSQGFAAEPLEEMDSSPEPPSQKTGRSDETAEDETEEAVDMELFVDTLRNMEPPELRKPLKHLPRPLRPSTLAKHAPLPPIHEYRMTPKSKVPLPEALDELFALTEERSSETDKEEEGGLAEEMEEIENPYLSKEDDEYPAKKTYPWENQAYKTEEEIGCFLGKLQQGCLEPKVSISVSPIVTQTSLIRANILKGASLLSGFVDKKVVEEKPYSRLDNSLLYSKFISPEKPHFKVWEKGKDGRSSPTLLVPIALKINRECQTSPSRMQADAARQSSPTEAQTESSSRLSEASSSSNHVSPRSKEAAPLPQAPSCPEAPHDDNDVLKKTNVRPGKIILYSESGFRGHKKEIWGDIIDATSWEFAHTISIRVVRGGWVMYEKPRFHGRKCVLAEGDVEISNPWKLYRKDETTTENAPFHIGSLKRVVRDYRIPEISLFAEENGEGTKRRFTDSSEDTRTHRQPLKAASIIVHSGLWLVYSKPFFDDDPYVLEPGGYPNLQAWGAKDPSICSMHPIKLGCPVVEKPGEPKALIYEKPHFQGHNWEVSRDIYNMKRPENSQDTKMSTVGSLRIIGGCWVGYEKEGFRGHQYLLEEGEYCDWTHWGGYNEQLVSLRLIRTDFLDPALVLFEAMDFEDGPSVELSEALPDVRLASYGTTTQSIHVLSGVWVAYEDKNFTGEQYILEKGVYRNCEDWGAANCQISSVQPILQVGEHSLHFVSKIQLFSDRDFLGHHVSYEEDQASLPDSFVPRSCRVHGGSWILYDCREFDGEQHVLSEGEYPTLTSMGCRSSTAIHSLKKVPIFFSEPSIFLHGLECFEGKEIELNSEVRSLQAEGFNNHVLSVRVKGGIWVLCEHSDFRGRQWLLDCIEITNWLTYSGLQHIGSLYPIRQRRIYFRMKNVELQSFLSVPDDVEDMKAGRVLVSALCDTSSFIWYYEEGLLKNQVAPTMSLQVIGPAGKGAKVVLWSESRMPRQTWRIDSFGKIYSQMFEDMILDVKGGRTYDRDHAVLWDSSEERPTKIWDIQVL